MKPDFFFKYLHPSLAVVLDSSSLRFTQPAYLNDPSEFLPSVDQFITLERLKSEAERAVSGVDLDDFFEAEFERAWGTISRQQRRSIDKAKARAQFRKEFDTSKDQFQAEGREFITSTIGSMDEVLLDRFSASMRDRLGVLCLSSTGSSELLWAHYADGHRGFALQFSSNHEFFQPEPGDSETLSGAQPVIYGKERPSLTEIIDENNQLELYFFRKSSAWAYEEEWRIVKPIAKADETFDRERELVALFKFPPKALDAVILGHRASSALVQTIRASLDANPDYRHVKLLRSEFAKDSYEIVHKQIGFKVCRMFPPSRPAVSLRVCSRCGGCSRTTKPPTSASRGFRT